MAANVFGEPIVSSSRTGVQFPSYVVAHLRAVCLQDAGCRLAGVRGRGAGYKTATQAAALSANLY